MRSLTREAQSICRSRTHPSAFCAGITSFKQDVILLSHRKHDIMKCLPGGLTVLFRCRFVLATRLARDSNLSLCSSVVSLWEHLPGSSFGRLRPLAEHGKLVARPPSNRDRGFIGRLRERYFYVPKKWYAHFYFFGLVACTLLLADIVTFGGSVVTTRLQVRKIGVVCRTIGSKRTSYN